MTSSPVSLDSLRQTRPEWTPWLAVVELALRDASDRVWQSVAVETHVNAPKSPLLAGATIVVEPRTVGALLDKLLRTAARAGTSQLAALETIRHDKVDPLALLSVSLSPDGDLVQRIAAAHGVPVDALDAIVRLLGIPMLMTYAGRHAARDSWVEPFCPVCGAWPAFVEVRGIERRRFYRCGRCGCQWHAQQLRCPFCSTTNHEELATLAPADPASAVSVDACLHCRGYVKSLTRLQGCRPDAVMLEDLATVDVDVAAVESGYARPGGVGHPLAIRVLRVDDRATGR